MAAESRVAEIVAEFQADRAATDERVALENLARALAGAERERRPRPAGLAFDELAVASGKRAVRWHPGGIDDWTVERWSNAMAGEAGEACGQVKRLNRIEDGIANLDAEGNDLQDRDEAIRAIGLELADVVIYADLLAQRIGLRLEDVVVEKFNRVSERYGFPERLP
jgi:NTP pyrophosphatase (non-canonical NTP hydrolase)